MREAAPPRPADKAKGTLPMVEHLQLEFLRALMPHVSRCMHFKNTRIVDGLLEFFLFC
jgi:hypothetical protein